MPTDGPRDLSRGALLARCVATLLGAALLLAGTLWGSDDHFPFGPLSMYAGVNPPDADAPDPRLEGIDANGTVVALTQRVTGIRRAEFEGLQERYRADPSQLASVARAYARRNPGAPALVEVRLVIRWHGIESSRPTGTWHDEVVATWRTG